MLNKVMEPYIGELVFAAGHDGLFTVIDTTEQGQVVDLELVHKKPDVDGDIQRSIPWGALRRYSLTSAIDSD